VTYEWEDDPVLNVAVAKVTAWMHEVITSYVSKMTLEKPDLQNINDAVRKIQEERDPSFTKAFIYEIKKVDDGNMTSVMAWVTYRDAIDRLGAVVDEA
jgi:hypothetical protein